MPPVRTTKASDLCHDFGGQDPSWVRHPPADAVVDAALAWIQHRAVRYLKEHDVRPPRLAELSETASAWRNKFQGTRAMSLRDLLEIAMALEPGILTVLPHELGDLRDLLPEEYHSLLSHHEPGRSMPQFRSRLIGPGWVETSDELMLWWISELNSGRQWTLTMDVVANRLVSALDEHGLPSRFSVATRQATRTDQLDIEWISEDIQLRLVWLDPSQEGDAAAVRAAVRNVGRHLWDLGTIPGCSQCALLITAPSKVQDILLRTLNLEAASVGEPVTVSMREARRLGLEEVDLRMEDIQVSLLCEWSPNVPFLWLSVKTPST